MLLELVKGLCADDMLDAAGVLSCGFGRNAQFGEQVGQHGVALVDGFGDLEPGFGQPEQAVLVNGDIAVVPQQADRDVYKRQFTKRVTVGLFCGVTQKQLRLLWIAR